VQLKPGVATTKIDILSFLEGKIAKWWMPDDIVIDSIPHTATGKIRKSELRERYRNHLLPGASDLSGDS
jgi:fatty-acyl-CoA synthase